MLTLATVALAALAASEGVGPGLSGHPQDIPRSRDKAWRSHQDGDWRWRPGPYYHYQNISGIGDYEVGHMRGHPGHWIARNQQQRGLSNTGHVRWSDSEEGSSGLQVWDLNHFDGAGVTGGAEEGSYHVAAAAPPLQHTVGPPFPGSGSDSWLDEGGLGGLDLGPASFDVADPDIPSEGVGVRVKKAAPRSSPGPRRSRYSGWPRSRTRSRSDIGRGCIDYPVGSSHSSPGRPRSPGDYTDVELETGPNTQLEHSRPRPASTKNIFLTGGFGSPCPPAEPQISRRGGPPPPRPPRGFQPSGPSSAPAPGTQGQAPGAGAGSGQGANPLRGMKHEEQPLMFGDGSYGEPKSASAPGAIKQAKKVVFKIPVMRLPLPISTNLIKVVPKQKPNKVRIIGAVKMANPKMPLLLLRPIPNPPNHGLAWVQKWIGR